MTTILLADDHDLVRVSISRMLSEVYGYKIVGEANNGETAVVLSRSTQPDIVLMDVMMPGIGGLEATRKIRQCCPKTKIIGLTGVVSDLFATQLMKAGASGYVTKDSGFDELIAAIKAVLNNELYMSNAIAQQIALRTFNGDDEGISPFEKLSERELQTAIMISSGSRVQQIAAAFSVSPKTINSYRYRIFEKLNLTTDVGLALLAVRHKLLEEEVLLE